MTTKEELTIRLRRSEEAYENAKRNEAYAARALTEAQAARERAKERRDENFAALELYICKTETAKVGY